MATLTERAGPARTNPVLEGSVHRVVLLLAGPVLGEQLLNFLVGFVDVLLAGHLAPDIRTEATAAVGVAAYVGWLSSMLFSLVATGTTALISRARGADEDQLANEIANRSMALSIALGICACGLLWLGAPLIVQLFGLSGLSAEIAIRYLRFDAIGLGFSSLSFSGAAALRGCGNMRTPMWILGGVSLLNMVVSVALVYGVGPLEPWGVQGIVAGTITARTLGGLTMLYCLSRGVSGLKLVAREMRLTGATVRRILAIGAPAAAEGLVMWLGHSIYVRIISTLGTAAFAAHIVAIRVEAVTYLPAVAWGAAAATVVGQSLGARDPQRAVHAGHAAALQCVGVGVLITLAFVGAPEWIVGTMNRAPEVREVGVPALRLLGFFQIPLTMGIVYFSALRGAGDTRFPLWVTLLTTYCLRLPLGMLCGVVWQGGLTGAYWGMCVDMLLRGTVAAVRFSRQSWLKVRV